MTLTATANSSSTFVGWSGACSGTSSTCVVAMSAAKAVTATFNMAATYSYFGSKNDLYCTNGSSATGFYFTTIIDGTSQSAFSTYSTSYAQVVSGQKSVTVSITNITCMPNYSGSFTYTLSPNYYYMFTLDGYDISTRKWHITIYYSYSADRIQQNKTELTIPAKFEGLPSSNSEFGFVKKMDTKEKLIPAQ